MILHFMKFYFKKKNTKPQQICISKHQNRLDPNKVPQVMKKLGQIEKW